MRKQLVSAGFLMASLMLIGAGCTPQPKPVEPTKPYGGTTSPTPAPAPKPTSGGQAGGATSGSGDEMDVPKGPPVTGAEPDLFNPAQ